MALFSILKARKDGLLLFLQQESCIGVKLSVTNEEEVDTAI